MNASISKIARKIARRPSAAAAAAAAAADAALEARNEYIRDAVFRLAPSAQAIVISSYERAAQEERRS